MYYLFCKKKQDYYVCARAHKQTHTNIKLYIHTVLKIQSTSDLNIRVEMKKL